MYRVRCFHGILRLAMFSSSAVPTKALLCAKVETGDTSADRPQQAYTTDRKRRATAGRQTGLGLRHASGAPV